MLGGGADIRYIPDVLGHADLKTTRIYAQVSIRQLKRIHTDTHPAQMPPEKLPVNGDNLNVGDSREDAAELLAALEAEAHEDPEDA